MTELYKVSGYDGEYWQDGKEYNLDDAVKTALGYIRENADKIPTEDEIKESLTKDGFYKSPNYIGFGVVEIRKIQPKTNEQWVHSMTTEQLAKFIQNVQFCCNTCNAEFFRQKNLCPLNFACEKENGFLEWLNEPHEEQNENG